MKQMVKNSGDECKRKHVRFFFYSSPVVLIILSMTKICFNLFGIAFPQIFFRSDLFVCLWKLKLSHYLPFIKEEYCLPGC